MGRFGVLVDYLVQPSTWKGIIQIAAACGIAFTDDQWKAVLVGLLVIAGAIDVVKDEGRTLMGDQGTTREQRIKEILSGGN